MPIGGNFDSNASTSESQNLWWNYTNPDKENFSLTLSGTVVEIHEVLSTYQQQVLWFNQKDDGTQDPKKDWMLVVKLDDWAQTEIRFSEGKHKQLWQQIWYSAIMQGEPEPAKESTRKYSLPDMLAGAHITIETFDKTKWNGSKARPWRARIDKPGSPESTEFRGFYEDWKTDTRYTESEQYRRNKEINGQAKRELQDTVQVLEQTNPRLAEATKRAIAPNERPAASAYADSDIPF